MFPKLSLTALALAAVAFGQQIGTNVAENHPSLPFQKCTKAGGCTTVASKIVLDANWRWTHNVGGSTNCYTGNTWDATLCPDGTTCATNCAVDGADYAGTYGITTSGNALTLKFVTQSQGKNIGSRVYLMADDSHYQMFQLPNQEFTFDVDVSNLPCGLNGALYFSEMAADGGLSAFPSNKAGAKYGTGYCDSQCPRDIKFINGVANSVGWAPSPNDPNTGTGNFGACCNEMDIWEANSVSSAFTPHPCQGNGLTRCSGTACGTTDRYGTVCDPDGCDFNSFRMGDKTFYGKGLTVDTSRKFTVVTQFLTTTGTSTGTVNEIRRLYVQDGKVIQNSKVKVAGMDATLDSVTGAFCDQAKAAFGDTPSFQNKGGMPAMSGALARGMVLVLSLWDDHAVNMLWLDSNFPVASDPTKPGVARGTCATTSGVPTDVESQSPNASVTYSNIKFGEIGSTFGGVATTAPGTSTTPVSTSHSTTPTTTPTTRPVTSTTTTASGPVQTKFGQCGGQGYTGPTVCAAGSTCQFQNPFYSQCL